MRLESADERWTAIAEARTWLGTPWHHMGGGPQIRGRKMKGIGIDCAQILVETYSEVGLIEWFDSGAYPADWHLHNDEERYVNTILRFAHEIPPEAVQGGDVIVWRYGRTFSHGGIVTGDPQIPGNMGLPWVLHAVGHYGCVLEDPVIGSPMEGRPVRCFSLWGASGDERQKPTATGA